MRLGRAMTWMAAAILLSAFQPAKSESLLAKLLRIAGLTAAPSQMRAPGDAEPGDIWIADLNARTTAPLTKDGGYRSPVFAPDGTLYALRGDTIVRVSAAGTAASPVRAPGAVKLVGFDGQKADEAIVLVEGTSARSPVAIVSMKSGAITMLPFDAKSADEQKMLAQMRGQERTYGDTTVYTKTESKRGLSRTIEWTDVYIRRGKTEPVNISHCDGSDCTEPALAPDGRRMGFVKAGG